MHLKRFGIWATMAVITAFAAAPVVSHAADKTEISEPEAQREFRGVWIATVANIDWPSRRGLSTAEQKQEMVDILNKCSEMNLNAIVLQVRPACDAIYDSKIEPWSDVLTGVMGKAPDPYYDPLKFTVEEAHKRGIEVHCWFNPYRALHPTSHGKVSDNHISKTQPDIVKKYGKYLWLNPTDQRTQDLSIDVVMDVVNRYDIDGVHMDDYFYPYPSYADGADFPDDDTWAVYQKSGGKLSRGDWRRAAVDKFVERLYKEVKAAKPHVKVGISPFGIAHPNTPTQVGSGFDQYNALYADAQLWLNKGWVDYYTPQLYWPIASPQPFLYLLKWWIGENTENRHIWPGLYTSRIAGDKNSLIELPSEIAASRFLGANGHVHFSMKPLMKNVNNVDDLLMKGDKDLKIDAMYAEPALIPASPWIDDEAPAMPKLKVANTNKSDADGTSATTTLSWKMGDDEKPWLWALYTLEGNKWHTRILPSTSTTLTLTPDEKGNIPSQAKLAAVDRNGNESDKAHAKINNRIVIEDVAPKEDQVK